MNRAFWDALPASVELEVEVFPNARAAARAVPAAAPLRHDRLGGPPGAVARGAGAAGGRHAGDRHAGRRLAAALPGAAPRRVPRRRPAGGRARHRASSRCARTEARALFAASFLPIRSWTVRSERCRASLLELGVDPSRVAVGCDWAWLVPRAPGPVGLGRGGAAGRRLGRARAAGSRATSSTRSGAGRTDAKSALARALDRVAARGAAVAFFCQEMRPGAFFDQAAAAEVRGRDAIARARRPARVLHARRGAGARRPWRRSRSPAVIISPCNRCWPVSFR